MLTRRGLGIQSEIGSLPIHPLLAAAYPVVFLFAANAAEQFSLDPLWMPLLLSVGATGVTLVVLWVVTGDLHLAGLLTTILAVGFFGYGHAWNAVAGAFDSQWPFLVPWVLGTILLIAVAFQWRRHARGVSRFLNIALALLLALNVWSLGTTMASVGAGDAPLDEGTGLVRLDPEDPDDLPDVYYIIPDRYGGLTALDEVYGHDNEPFLRALEERGFGVARHAHGNYMRTITSLTSALSMDYLDAEAFAAEADNGSDWRPVFEMFKDRLAVPAAFEQLGYTYVHLGNWWSPTATNVDADLTLKYEGQDEFRTAFTQTTLLRALTDADTAPDDPWDWRSMRLGNIWSLDRLEEIPNLPGPKYVFAHLTTTHEPYVHNEDGSFTGREQVEALGRTESYRRQLVYTNTRLLGIVDRIIAHDPDSIIVLMSDEGPFPDRYADNDRLDWPDATDMELEQKSGILYALRIPGADLEAEGFHDRITPVNAFRIVFNARFGADLPLLPDRTFFYRDVTALYEWTEMTDRLP